MSIDHGTLAFIGGGNMARCLIGGLIAGGLSPKSIRVADPIEQARKALVADFGVAASADNLATIDGADTIVLAIKPQQMRAVCESLAPSVQAARPLLVSIAAGITSGQIDGWAGGELAVVRTMPNTPSLVALGATGLYANPRVDADQRARADALMAAVGVTVWIDDEALMDAVTAVSGSGPAYVFLLAEAMQAAGEAQGLPPDAARTLAARTLLGAATMLERSNDPASTLRERVTSPGGTTAAALATFEDGGFRELVNRAVAAATKRGQELAAGS